MLLPAAQTTFHYRRATATAKQAHSSESSINSNQAITCQRAETDTGLLGVKGWRPQAIVKLYARACRGRESLQCLPLLCPEYFRNSFLEQPDSATSHKYSSYQANSDMDRDCAKVDFAQITGPIR